MSEITAYIHDPERRAEWLAVLGTDHIPVTSMLPTWATLPGHESALIYELDINSLNSDQLQRLITHLAEKFGLDIEYVRREVINSGMPILANDVSVMGVTAWWI